MATIWITGAKGFIGRHLARHLETLGERICGIGHGIWPSLEASSWGVEHWVNGEIDAANLESLRRRAGDPTAIYHLAGGSSVGSSIANPLEDFARTVASTARLLEWMRDAAPAAKLVAISSAAVYGSQYPKPIPPDAPTRPYSPYGHHKSMMEQLCRSYGETFGLRCTVVRLFSVYGPWLRKQLLWDLCSRIAVGETPIRLAGTGAELRDWTEVSDVVRLLRVAESLPGAPGETLNGGSAAGTCVADVAALVIRSWGGEKGPVTFSGERRPGDPFSLVADGTQLRGLDFRWEVALPQGIDHYVRWFREERR